MTTLRQRPAPFRKRWVPFHTGFDEAEPLARFLYPYSP
jgi:hypothetical protein